MATRTFTDCVNSAKHQFGEHPGDYTLFELGFFDDATAVFDPHSGPVKVANGIELVRSRDNESQRVLDLEVVSDA